MDTGAFVVPNSYSSLPSAKTALVVGAGIAGLATALSLKRAGFSVRVAERTASLPEVGAGLSLWHNALEALAALGLREEVVARGRLLRRLRIAGSSGASFSEMDLMRLYGGRGAPAVCLHRAELQSLLADSLFEAAGDGVLLADKSCVGFAHGPERIEVYFTDGSHIECDLLVGADGIHSTIRRQLWPGYAPGYEGYIAWRGVAPYPYSLIDDEGLLELWGRGRRFGLLPMGQGRVYWYATSNAKPGKTNKDGPADADKGKLLADFRGFPRPVEDLIAATPAGALIRNGVFALPSLPHWGKGGIVLIGDAAHAMSPNLGQGGCQALEDAVALGRCVATWPLPEALRRFHALRAPRVRYLRGLSSQVGFMGQWENRFLTGLRDSAMRLMPNFLGRPSLEKIYRPSI